MWTNREMERLAAGRHTDAEKRVLVQSIAWWQDCIFAMRVMNNDAPNPIDKELMTKIIGHLERRITAMSMGVTKN